MIDLDISKYLPHRYPFLFVDKVISIDKKCITAVKNVTHNESFFQGHFPGDPIMPGVIIIEALAQAAAILGFKAHDQTPGDGYSVYLVSVEKVRFRQAVRPGDQLTLKVEMAYVKRSIGCFHCHAFVGEKEVCSLSLKCIYQKREEDG